MEQRGQRAIPNAHLVRWPDPRHLSLHYGGGRLVRVRDETGRELGFEYTPGEGGLWGDEERRFSAQAERSRRDGA